VVPAEPLQTLPLEYFSALFQSGHEVSFGKSKDLLEFPKKVGKAPFALVKLNDEASAIPCEPIKLPHHGGRGADVSVLHYLKKEPVLKCAKGTCQTTPAMFGTFSFGISEGSTGAPMLDEACRLVGVYSSRLVENKYTVFNIDHLVTQLREARTTPLTPDLAQVIQEVFEYAGLEAEDLVTNRTYNMSEMHSELTTRNVVISVAEGPEHEGEECDLQKSVICINSRVNQIWVCPPDYCQQLKFPCYESLTNHCACVMTPAGLVITGANIIKKNGAWLWTQKMLQELPDMLGDHESHSSLLYKGRVYTVSGRYSAAVEYFEDDRWTLVEPLPQVRSNATGIAFNELIYVFGGQAEPEAPLSNLIFTSNGTSWQTLGVRLVEPLRSAGALVVDDKLLVFGGKKTEEDSERSDDNTDTWFLDAQGNFSTGPQFRRSGKFTSSPGCLAQGFHYVYSQDGSLVQFSPQYQRFAVVTLSKDLL
jgi:hypothetical protein